MGSDPDILIDLTNEADAERAHLLAGYLEREGVPAYSGALAGSMLPWDLASTGPFRVAVRRSDVEQACRLVAEYRMDAQRINWESVDVGEPEPDIDLGQTCSPEWRRTRRKIWVRRLAHLSLCGICLWTYGAMFVIAAIGAAIVEVRARKRMLRPVGP